MRAIDLNETKVRELNQALHDLDPETNETHWVVSNPGGRHAVAVGVDAPVSIEINGHVGYYCASMNRLASVVVHGNAGVGVAENMMSGEVRVKGDVSQAAGATGNGGLLVVEGNASARCGISMKGIDIIVKGSIGPMSAFMAQAGHLVVLGDAGEALGDSIYEAKLFVRGAVKSLGADCIEKQSSAEELATLAGRVTGVKVGDETLQADVVVNASGPWAGRLGQSVGLDMPLRVVREQDSVWEVRQGRPIPDGPISNQVDLVYARPLGNRRFVVGRSFPKPYYDVDPESYKREADEEIISDILERLERRYSWFQGAARIDSYAALYDATPDWYPFAGPRKGVQGYVDAWGGSGHGFKLAPAIGRRLADWIADGETDDEFRQMSHDRVVEDRLFVQRFGGNRG